MLIDVIREVVDLSKTLLPKTVAIYFSAILIIWRAFAAIKQYIRRPRNMLISGKPVLVGQWLSAFDFIYQGADRIARAYTQAGNAPFAIPALSNYQVLVSSPEDVQKLANAPEEDVSFRKALFDRLFFTYTMGGFTPNHIDPHNSIPVRVFKVLARENLQSLSAPVASNIGQVFDEQFKAGRRKQNEDESDVKLHMLSGTLIARMNNELLFGQEMARDPTFEKDSIKYGWDSAYAMEVFRQIPTCFVPLFAKMYMTWSGAMYRVTRRVQVLVNERLRCQQDAKSGKKGLDGRKHQDGTDWVISCSHTPAQAEPLRIAQQMMALLFASTHQMQMAVTWAIVDLCLHPEYVALLRAEIEEAWSVESGDPYSRLRMMDCFLRESSRLNPLDSLNMQRKAMVPLKLSNNTIVPAGNLVAIPQREIMRDPNRFRDPETFNPSRFVPKSSSTEAVAKYTDVNWDYTFWGSPHLPCPGRWYASYAMKHVLVHLLKNYDFELLNLVEKRYFTWTTAMVPKNGITARLRKREVRS